MAQASELHNRKYRDSGSWARLGGFCSSFQAPAVKVSSDVNSEARLDWGVFEVDPRRRSSTAHRAAQIRP